MNRDVKGVAGSNLPAGDTAQRVAPHRALTEYYGEPAERSRFVRELFDGGAPQYDWVSSVLSFGTDRRYRRQALQSAGVRAGMKVLDVATGTGLVAQAALDCGVCRGIWWGWIRAGACWGKIVGPECFFGSGTRGIATVCG
jgi:hypothetical protein